MHLSSSETAASLISLHNLTIIRIRNMVRRSILSRNTVDSTRNSLKKISGKIHEI